MLRAISVKNYRSFADLAKVHLRPITILLGRNSAGKSSITRLFPLLQQSLERGTSAPILWSSPSIDFGRITDVISRAHPKQPFELTFELADHSLMLPMWRWHMMPTLSPRASSLLNANVAFTAFLSAGAGGKTEYHRLRITIDRDVIDIEPRGTSAVIYINGRRMSLKPSWGKLIFAGGRLFPHLAFVNDDKGRPYSDGPDTSGDVDPIVARIFSASDDRATQRARARSPFGASAAPIPFVPRDNLLAYLRELPGLLEQNVTSSLLNELFDLLLITYLPSVIETVGAVLTPALTNLSYLGPIRASGNRFYRERELSVDKIDDKGENLATYIGSLSQRELDSFNQILFSAFGVEVRPHPVEGHLSIDIGKPGDDHFDNLADVGFGYSQLLPLVAQLHADGRRNDTNWRQGNSNIQITAVEQPELHLHPAYQANLADLFVASVRASRSRDKTPVIIIETHSEALIGRLGELVALNQISAEDIAIHFVDKSEMAESSTIRKETFDDDGMIVNWPVGFFSARKI